MTMILNKSPAPLVFNVRGGAPNVSVQRTLMPGESGDLDLAVEIEKDRVVGAWKEAQMIEVGARAKRVVGQATDGQALREAQQKAAAAAAEVARLQEQIAAAELDTDRRAVPRQLSTDGGPQQSGTVDGQGGLLTPTQAEQGRAEPPATGTTSVVTSGTPRPPAGAASPPKRT